MSHKPSKHRKRLWNASLHRRRRVFSAYLSVELAAKYGRMSFPMSKGDTVRVVRGDYKGTEGKVRSIGSKSYRVTIEGVTREKADGKTVFIPLHPSKVEITKLNLSDKWRQQRLSSQKISEEAEGEEEAEEAEGEEEAEEAEGEEETEEDKEE